MIIDKGFLHYFTMSFSKRKWFNLFHLITKNNDFVKRWNAFANNNLIYIYQLKRKPTLKEMFFSNFPQSFKMFANAKFFVALPTSWRAHFYGFARSCEIFAALLPLRLKFLSRNDEWSIFYIQIKFAPPPRWHKILHLL